MLELTDVKRRWQLAYEAKTDELDRLEQVALWVYEFERHIREGEMGDEIYRFPEMYGYISRRYNNFIEVLPECKVTGKGSVGLQASIDKEVQNSNLISKKLSCLASACAYGTSALFVAPYEHKRRFRDGTMKTLYRGLAAEHVEWKYLFPAPSALTLHDHTGLTSCPYIFRKRVYHVDTFKRIAQANNYKNWEDVQGTSWGDSNVFGEAIFKTAHEEQEIVGEKDYVTVLEYWDYENDIFNVYASGGKELYSSPNGIPYSHKMLPFIVYKNSHKIDSINGVGEVAINLPYNLFREKILNLGIKGTELSIQPALVVDGDIGFNTEEQVLSSGAVFSTRGLNGGKLQDHIMPLQMPDGLSNSVFQMIQTIENSRISVTSDDTTALYSNPNQLATQTLAKMQSLNRSIESSTQKNLYDAEYYLTLQISSLIKNEFSAPYKDDKGVNRFKEITISGYDVVQNSKDGKADFIKGRDTSGKFYLNSKVAKSFEEAEITIISARRDEELKKDKNEKLMTLLNNIMTTMATIAQYNPSLIQPIFGNMNLQEFLKTAAKALGLTTELSDIFPVIKKEGFQLDAVSAEHDQIIAGITPSIRSDEDSLTEFDSHTEFKESAFFKKYASPKAVKAMDAHLLLTAKNVQLQNSKPVEQRQQEVDAKSRRNNISELQIPGGMATEQANGSREELALQETRGAMERGLSGGATNSN